MIAFYKDDKEAGRSICAYWYLRATFVTKIDKGSVHYKLVVGDTLVLEDDMPYETADEAYNSYFAD